MEVGQCSGSRRTNHVVLELENEPEKCGGMLVGKIFTSKNLNIPAVITMIKKGWQLDEDLEVHELDRNNLIFRFRFRNVTDYARILKGRPWSVQGFLLNLQIWENFMVPNDVSFDETLYWVQFHGLPIEAFSNANAKILGDSVGTAVMYEKPKLAGRIDRSFIRVPSLIRLDNPLTSGFWIPRKEKEPAWITVKYERLQNFCYYCGRLSHDGRRCKDGLVQHQGEDAVKEFGNWLSTSTAWTNEEALEVCAADWCEVPFIKKATTNSNRRSWKSDSPKKEASKEYPSDPPSTTCWSWSPRKMKHAEELPESSEEGGKMNPRNDSCQQEMIHDEWVTDQSPLLTAMMVLGRDPAPTATVGTVDFGGTWDIPSDASDTVGTGEGADDGRELETDHGCRNQGVEKGVSGP